MILSCALSAVKSLVDEAEHSVEFLADILLHSRMESSLVEAERGTILLEMKVRVWCGCDKDVGVW